MGAICSLGCFSTWAHKMNQTSRNLTDLCAEMHELAIQFQRDCQSAGLSIVIICTYRSDADQQIAFDSGKSNCRPGQSEHNHLDSMGKPASRAFDIGVIRAGKYIGDGKDPDYLAAGKIGEALGLEWAGRWSGKLREVAHFQLPKEK